MSIATNYEDEHSNSCTLKRVILLTKRPGSISLKVNSKENGHFYLKKKEIGLLFLYQPVKGFAVFMLFLFCCLGFMMENFIGSLRYLIRWYQNVCDMKLQGKCFPKQTRSILP